MSYSLIIKDNHELHIDVVEIVRDLNERKKGLGSDFLVAFEDTLARLENRLGREVQVKFEAKFEDVYGEAIIAERNSPSHAKKFKDYYVYYILQEEKREAIILAVAYGPRDPDYLRRLLSGRK